MKEWNLQPGVVLTEIHGTYLLAADNEARKICGYIHEINEIGAFIWRQMEAQKCREEILALLREEYDIPESIDLEKDVDNFLDSMRENHYLMNEA